MLRLVVFLKKVAFKDFRFYATISFLFLIIFFTQKNLWFGDQSKADLRNLEKEILILSEERLKLENQNKLLEEEKIKLSSGREAIEGLARSELGLIKPGEKFYIFEPIKQEDISKIPEIN